MNTETDPLSDEAWRQWAGALNECGGTSLRAWQECARRATEKRDADLESLHVYYRAENKRLRALDASVECLLKSMANGAFTEKELRNEASLILKARAALEGERMKINGYSVPLSDEAALMFANAESPNDLHARAAILHGFKECARRARHLRAASESIAEYTVKLHEENKRLRDLLNLEREFADKLINEVDQSVTNAICDEIEYHEKRAALEGE